jgi:hypothetical protein
MPQCTCYICLALTFGRTKSELNLEKILNISWAFRAVAKRSLRREMIWFSTRATRSL